MTNEQAILRLKQLRSEAQCPDEYEEIGWIIVDLEHGHGLQETLDSYGFDMEDK